jgi:DNA-binding protein YbaB
MVADFERLLVDARAQVERLRAATPPGHRPTDGDGTAWNGRISTTMAADGRLTRLTLDPAVRDLDPAALAQEIVTAVNRAWAARDGVDESTAAAATMDPATLGRQLAEVQEQSIDAMRRYTEGLQDAVARIARSAQQ